MKTLNLKKKGFTIVELVIVIAVIVILAAILIPTFANIVKKAETAADIQTVKNLNTIVLAESAEKGQIKTAHDAVVAALENGYNLEYITPTADGRTIAWDGGNYQFVLLNDENEVIFPDDDKPETAIDNMFIISDSYPNTNFDGFAVYLTSKYEGTSLEVTTGVDVGYNDDITTVTYKGTSEVTIRTNSELCNFIMDSGIVNHYGVALKATVNTDKENYHCYAKLMDTTVYGNGVEPTLLFAGGQGTKENPYLVATDEHLTNLEKCSGKTTYLKLVDDITFTTNEYEEGEYGYIDTYFQGELDGNGHSIINTNSDTEGPCLFFGTYYGNTVVKNLTYVIAGDVVKPLFYRNYSGYNCDGTALTIENVTVKGAEEKVYDLCGYGSSPFILSNSGAVYFKNCVNEISYTIPGSGYGGIFIGNYGFPETFASFENCVNKGTINGVYPGFFCGNETKDITLVDNNDVPTFSSTAQVFYINNCSNEGVILGSKAVGAFGCNWPDIDTSHDLCDNSLTESQFHRGTMLVADIKVGLTFNEKDITINGSDDSNVYNYSISFSAYVSYGDAGNSNFTYTEYISKEDVEAGKTIKDVTGIITRAEYETAGGIYDESIEQIYSTFRYIVVSQEDGTRIIVVDMTNNGMSEKFEKFGDIEYAVSAYNISNQRIGYEHYKTK